MSDWYKNKRRRAAFQSLQNSWASLFSGPPRGALGSDGQEDQEEEEDAGQQQQNPEPNSSTLLKDESRTATTSGAGATDPTSRNAATTSSADTTTTGKNPSAQDIIKKFAVDKTQLDGEDSDDGLENLRDKTRLRPAQTFLGRYSITRGVLVIGFTHLFFCVFFLCSINSTHALNVFGVSINESTQVWFGAWFLLGIPIVIGGGIGVVYRVEFQLRRYYYYLVFNTSFIGLHVLGVVFSGQLCNATTSPYLRELASTLVCGSTNFLALLWIFIGAVVSAYCTWIVWSAAEEVQMAFFPELEAHLLKLEAERKKGYDTMPNLGSALTSQAAAENSFRRKMEKLNKMQIKSSNSSGNVDSGELVDHGKVAELIDEESEFGEFAVVQEV
ncbi:unnamed protein product [Amoebophrya sp. A120]|nr:unnamed protein product [Amoebophrya sp. A120]|eukprot:GSA120T00007085001.1